MKITVILKSGSSLTGESNFSDSSYLQQSSSDMVYLKHKDGKGYLIPKTSIDVVEIFEK